MFDGTPTQDRPHRIQAGHFCLAWHPRQPDGSGPFIHLAFYDCSETIEVLLGSELGMGIATTLAREDWPAPQSWNHWKHDLRPATTDYFHATEFQVTHDPQLVLAIGNEDGAVEFVLTRDLADCLASALGEVSGDVLEYEASGCPVQVSFSGAACSRDTPTVE